MNSSDDLDKFMIRVAYQQFPDFYGELDTLARTHLLFRNCAKTVGDRKGFDIDAAYKEATGLTLDQVWDITLALCGLIGSGNGGIQAGPFSAGDLTPSVSDSDVR